MKLALEVSNAGTQSLANFLNEITDQATKIGEQASTQKLVVNK